MRTYQLQDDASTRSTPTPHSVSMTMSAITASPHACSGCCTARGSLLTNNPAKLYGLTKAGIEIASRMPLEAPINADNRRWQRVPDTGSII
jgi:GTP cyclohydrolase II